MEDLTLSSITEFLGDLRDIHLDSFFNDDVETPFQTKPHEFLRFAEYDLRSSYEHHLVNALSNIKRAIDCQLDSLLVGFGLFDESKRKKLSFPKKVVWLDSFGIISPQILKRINKQRNLLEHEYMRPRKNDVEDAFDVAKLFIAYTDKFLCRALLECEPYNDKIEESFEIHLDYKKTKLTLSMRATQENGRLETIKKDVSAKAEEYPDYLKMFLGLYRIN
jgi:hypothetical protein